MPFIYLSFPVDECKARSYIANMGDATYELTFKRQAITALRRMPRQEAEGIRRRLERLAQNPTRRDMDVAPLTGRPGFRL